MLFKTIQEGTSPDKVVTFAKEYLRDNGFEEVYYDKNFQTNIGGKYFISPFPDVLFAFTMGSRRQYIQSMRMAFAHVDQPCFKIKGKPDLKNMGCAQLNVEVYGGMTAHTWFDRPLGISGLIALRGDDAFHPQMVAYDSRRALAIIPGLAIHMKREMNDGWKIDRQKELMPVIGLSQQWTQGSFLSFLASELSVEESNILSYDLNLYNMDQPQLVGLREELIAAPRLDNLASVSTLLEAIVEGERTDGINLIGLFDHEEVGSVSKSGADSGLLHSILLQIFLSMNGDETMLRASLGRSYYLSVDGAHGAHPNYPDRCDTTTRAILGEGVTLKVSGTCKYASDCKMKAIISALSEKYDIPLQEVGDHNNIRGGSTLGPMIGAQLPMTGCDLGIPMWAMHSAQETIAQSDYEALSQMVTAFFAD